MPVLLLLFIIVPIVELAIIIQVGSSLGVLPTVVLLIAVSIVGAWLVKFQGLGVMRRISEQLAKGEMPTTELVNGGMILFAGALMLTPGFFTDAVGLGLLLPPVRAVVRPVLARRFRGRIQGFDMGGNAGGGGFGFTDTTASDPRSPDDPSNPELDR
jgi:UPF0716 protein FxsA